MEENRKKLVIWFFLFLGAANIFAWAVVYELSAPQTLEVNFLDVGQGDAAFIKMPYGHQVLIDGGPDDSVLEKLSKEMPFWDRDIDLVILTHPEHDHFSGLLEVFKRYEIRQVLWTGVLRDTAEYREWKRLIKEEGAQETAAVAGQKIKSGPAVINVLFPFDNLFGQEISNTNNSSVVLGLHYGATSFLFMGDAYQSVERKLVKQYQEDINTDVLKIGHHGSKTSTAEDFLTMTSPDSAVISAGEGNRYGHPHEEVLELLGKYDINVLRTDRHGDIEMISDGNEIIIRTENN